MIAAPALSATMSRRGPRSPFKTDRIASAASSTLRTTRSESFARGRPNCSGAHSRVVTSPSFSSATSVLPVVVISSRPSSPWTTRHRSLPRFLSTAARTGGRAGS